VSKHFGGLRAADDVTFSVTPATIHALIGPNGAGKTTLFNCFTGVLRPTSGSVLFHGRDITGLRSHALATGGIGRTFQTTRLFRTMTVIENVMAAGIIREQPNLLTALLRFTDDARVERTLREQAAEFLAFVGLGDCAGQRIEGLAPGPQRIAEIARALMLRPTILMLDEPAAGMNPREKVELADLLRRIRSRGLTILLIEHSMRLVMQVSDTVTVLNYGRVISEGPPDRVAHDPAVIKAYLGGREG
jgi:branched-chain amino acid transport system ATP-binding protein